MSNSADAPARAISRGVAGFRDFGASGCAAFEDAGALAVRAEDTEAGTTLGDGLVADAGAATGAGCDGTAAGAGAGSEPGTLIACTGPMAIACCINA